MDLVKHGVYNRLKKKFNRTYKDKKSGYLAAAVTNELFSVPPVDTEGKNFLEKNRELIEKKLAEIKNDNEIRKIVTDTLTMRMQLISSSQKSGDIDKKPGAPVANLKKRGLFLKNTEPPSLKQLINMARKFYSSSLQKK